MQKIKNKFCFADVCICLLVIISALVPIAVKAITDNSSIDNICIISVDGEKAGYRMDEKREIEISSNGISIKIVIENETVKVIESDCPDKICVNTGEISSVGQIIVCVPAKVMVSIVGSGDDDADWIVY